MAATLNTSLIRVNWTNIVTQGVDRDVIVDRSDNLLLFLGLHIDPSLFGYGYYCTANFRVIEVATNQTFNHYWSLPLDSIQQWAPDPWIAWDFRPAESAGVRNGPFTYLYTGRQGDGLYLYRPYFLIFRSPIAEDVHAIGISEFAVSGEHYFLLEGGHY